MADSTKEEKNFMKKVRMLFQKLTKKAYTGHAKAHSSSRCTHTHIQIQSLFFRVKRNCTSALYNHSSC